MLDDLYRAHPSEFVAARDALAKELRQSGERDEADRVKKLRRPSAAAGLLNVAALTQPKALKEFAAASEALESAQRQALEGGDEEASRWRAAAARERDAAQAVIDAAERAAADSGHPATKQALDLVDATLRAAAVDPELRERVMAGRLEREQSAATIGALHVGGPPARAGKTSAKRSAKRRDVAQARRDLERLERELAEALAREERLLERVDEAAEALRREQVGLAKGQRETADLKRQVKVAERRAKT